MRKRHGKARFLGVALIVGVLAAGTYAFTNTNTVPGSRAGQGIGAITGFTITNVAYNESLTNPHKLASVEFDLDTAADVVKISVENAADGALGETSQEWYDCVGVLTHYTCDTGATDLLRPEMADADELDVMRHPSTLRNRRRTTERR